jgi:prolycopene isomerase
VTAPHGAEPQADAYDVVVVGSGLGGVSAAALLAKNGRRVLVVEQGDGAGGFAHGFRRDRYKFDSAIRVIAEGEMIESLLGYLGVQDLCKLTLIDHMYRAYFPGFSLFAPIGLKEFMEAHIREFPNEADGIRKFFGLRRQMFLETAQLPMRLSPTDMADAMERFPTVFKYRTATLGEVMDEFFTDPRLKALCSALWPYMGTTPSRLSFFAYSQFLGVLVDGPFYCQGTFQNLVDAFVTALERNGGELVLKTAVNKIHVEDGRVTGVALSTGREIKAPVVVSNADARHTFEELVGVEHLPPAFVKRFQRLKPSASACVVYAATRMDVLKLDPAHETFVYNHWDHEETWRDILAGKPGGMSLSVMTMLDRSLAPPDEHLIIITAVAPYDIGRPWKDEKDRYTDSLLGQFETSFPGLRDSLTFMQSSTPLTLERYTRNHRGATYGWELIPSQIGAKRISHQSPISGLYLSGHWTEEGPASFRVVLSGMNTARLVLADLGQPDAIPSFKPADVPPLAI